MPETFCATAWIAEILSRDIGRAAGPGGRTPAEVLILNEQATGAADAAGVVGHDPGLCDAGSPAGRRLTRKCDKALSEFKIIFLGYDGSGEPARTAVDRHVRMTVSAQNPSCEPAACCQRLALIQGGSYGHFRQIFCR
jgi:hypothetical protein